MISYVIPQGSVFFADQLCLDVNLWQQVKMWSCKTLNIDSTEEISLFEKKMWINMYWTKKTEENRLQEKKRHFSITKSNS